MVASPPVNEAQQRRSARGYRLLGMALFTELHVALDIDVQRDVRIEVYVALHAIAPTSLTQS